MRKIFLLMILAFTSANAYAQEYTSNSWASWGSVTASSATTWVFPYRSRSITIMNGSTNAVCVALGAVTINVNCVSTVANQQATGNNKVFQLPGSQWITLPDIATSQINLMGVSATASPVSVLVNY